MKTISWNLTDAELSELTDELRFNYYKWDIFVDGKFKLIPEAIVLTQAEHNKIVAVAESLGRSLVGVEQFVLRNNILSELAIPEYVAKLIRCGSEQPLQLARYDLFPTVDGRLLASEFNEDVPGGFNETVGAPSLLAGRFGDLSFPGDFAGSFCSALSDVDVVSLCYATGYSEDLQHMLILERELKKQGHEVIRCSPSQVRWALGRPRVINQAIDAIVRFYPGEWFAFLPNRKAWARVIDAVKMFNPLRSLIRQSKNAFALWFQDNDLDHSDRAILQNHTPYTEAFCSEAVERYRNERMKWVIKRAFGRMGDNVLLGSLVSEQEWDEGLKQAQKEPEQYTIQECFEVEPLRFNCGSMFPALGVYLINGRFAGYYSRVAERPFLTHEAYYVPTLVEAS